MNIESSKLFNKNFTLVLIGQIISLFGNSLLRFVLPLHLLRLTGSSTLFGLVTATSLIPMIVLSMLGGVLADRVNKRNIMVVLDFVTALVIIVFYFALGQMPIIPLFMVVLMLLNGISGLYQPTVHASVPVLVSDDKIPSANSMISMVGTLSGLLGPAIGGIIYGEWGIIPILIVSTICVVFAAIMEIFIKIPYIKQSSGKGVFSIVKDDLKGAVVFIKIERPLFFNVVAIFCAINMIFVSAMAIGMPVIIIEILNLTDSMLGFNQSLSALGGLVGGLMCATLARKLKPQDLYVLLVFLSIPAAVMGVTLLLSTSSVMVYYILTAMVFMSKVSSTMFLIQLLTLLQRQTPSQILGKVTAVMITLTMCAQPVGQVLYGWFFDIFSNNSGIILLGTAAVTLAIALYSKGVFKRIIE